MDIPSDDNVQHDSGRARLALRLMFHEVRTSTIVAMTGFSPHQLRLLRRQWGITAATRHRGRSPTSLRRFTGSRRLRRESAALAAFCRIHGAFAPVGGTRVPRRAFVNGHLAERLCEAYEAYRGCFPRCAFTFEEALTLAIEIARGELIGLGVCARCGVTMLVDRLAPPRETCGCCHRECSERRLRRCLG